MIVITPVTQATGAPVNYTANESTDASVPKINPELENVFSSIDALQTSGGEQKKPKVNITGGLTKSLQKLSLLASRKSGLKSVALSEEDANELADALEPLMDDLAKYIDVLPYLPLVIFVIGYAAGIIAEVLDRRKHPSTAPDAKYERIQHAIERERPTAPEPKPENRPPANDETERKVETNSEASVSITV